jgi:hypothetical protein
MRIGITLQNNTHELLTVEGSSVLNGIWQNPAPGYGDVVPKLSTATFWSEMDKRWEANANSWLIAWIRFGTTKGYVKLGGAYNADVQGSELSEDERKREISTGGANSPFRAHVFVPRLLDAQVFVTGTDPDIYVQVFLASKVGARPHASATRSMLGTGATRFVGGNGGEGASIAQAERTPTSLVLGAPLGEPVEGHELDKSLYEESVRIEPIHTGVDWNKAPFI